MAGMDLWFLVYFKKEAFKYWLSGAEKFGTPTVVASVPGVTPEAEQNKALTIAESVSSETAVVKPDTMVLELLESKRANDTTMWEHLIGQFNSEISKAGQGNDATTEQSTHGSRASVGAFYAMERVLTKADADLVCDTINRTLVKWFVEVNFPGAELPRVYRSMDEPKDLTEQAKSDTLVSALGFTPSLEYVRETYGGHWDKAAAPAAAEGAPGEQPMDPGLKGQVEAAKSPNAPAGQ
jgi:phage gp29-like protein